MAADGDSTTLGANPKPFDLEAFKAAFAPMAAELGMRWTVDLDGPPAARGSFLLAVPALHGRPAAPLATPANWSARFPLIVSNHRDVEKLAAFYGIPFEHVPVTAGDARRSRGAAA